MMEVQEAHGDFILSQNSELRNLGTMPGSSSPVSQSEDVSNKIDGEDGTMFDTGSTPVRREGKDTVGLTSQPEAQ
jgi:hypothetical protein